MPNGAIRLLTANDVELRIKQITETKKGVFVTLLVYKDARTDMDILDEAFGPMNWQRKHKLIGNAMYCAISVWDADKKQWVEKEDAGKESYSETEKGQASDSFKRSGVNWGIGRELYNAPKIRIKLEAGEFIKEGNVIKTYKNFSVKSMVYDKENSKYTEFTVVDEKGNEKFSLKRSTIKPNVTDNRKQEDGVAVCSGCGVTITDERVVQYSVRFYNQPLCRDCQKASRKAA